MRKCCFEVSFCFFFLQKCSEGPCFISSTFIVLHIINIMFSQMSQCFPSAFHLFCYFLGRQFDPRCVTIVCTLDIVCTCLTSLQHQDISSNPAKSLSQCHCVTHGPSSATYQRLIPHILQHHWHSVPSLP